MQAKQVRKSANNLASIAIFVAKSACKYVICNTYIPRVYIKIVSSTPHPRVTRVSPTPHRPIIKNKNEGKA